MDEKFMTVKDYAAKFSITEKTVYNRIKSGKIPPEKTKKILNITLVKV
jgi:predicted DNA-binding transcriptional regulator AlpA